MLPQNPCTEAGRLGEYEERLCQSSANMHIPEDLLGMSANPASLQNQRDESFCQLAARRGNHSAPNEGSLVDLPKWRCNKTACLTDG